MSETSAPRTRRDDRREETRARILDAAIAAFAAKGFDGTRVAQIGGCCEIPVPLILYHFKTKEGLWRAAVDEVYRRLHARLAEEVRALDGLTGRAFYRAAIRAHLRTLIAEPYYMRIVFQEGVEDSERLRWLVKHHQEPFSAQIIGLIEMAQTEGLMPPGDPVHLKYVVSGALSLPITLAAEYLLMTGIDPTSDAALERHIEACMAILFKD